MTKRKIVFGLSLVPVILIIIALIVCIFLFRSLIVNFEIISFISLLLVGWLVIIFIQQSYFIISEEGILFPSEYLKKTRLFKNRVILNPKNIKSIDLDNSFYDVGGNESNVNNFIVSNISGFNRVHRPQLLIVELVSGEKKKFSMKIYTKNSVKKLIKSISQINQDIIISEELKKEINL